MIPIFSSLNMMQRALEVNQEVIQTTGDNISNANTDGYSRQRVDLTTWTPFPASGINAARGAGQIGTGVTAGSISRIRDTFVDLQVRDNTNQNGYWSAVNDAYSQMENIVNEPSDSGISTVLNNFWQSLQDLASNAGTSGTGSVVLQNGAEVADTFNYIAGSLGKVQNNISDQINENTSLVNNYADQLTALNKQINNQEANGFLPNDLYDQRDAIVDKLSALVNVKVTTTPSGGNPVAGAVGRYSIELVDKDGKSYVPSATLVDGQNLTNNHLQTTQSTDMNGNPQVAVTLVDNSGNTLPASGSANLNNMSGKLQGEIDSYTVDFPAVMNSLDNMAQTLASKFNAAYATSAGGSSKGEAFFLGDGSGNSAGTVTAANIHVNADLKGSDVTANVASGASGDNTSAIAMADVLATNAYDIDGNGSSATLQNYLESLIGQIGVNAQSADQFSTNTNSLLTAAQNRRSSISGVSTDEELTNLIQYQQSYAASAKVVNTLDTMLDTIINKMGV
ncbi:flagellar hook-associated protein FlgK [Sporolactobacillus spathodeae]|uniref:Flagellar hook-associated protein 1 n=1 Tax=Sporolactobacillus spathodeae TaxID=1465502 RepID=A0ABS2Q7I3_9BACL|nr:flagellar hook-associated protein FlgK [Sporolactobacillus spathodeae]MBM7657260.1 flagellar hook-associated protein 1 FlgK [Sporolactobacillus spathodeae]